MSDVLEADALVATLREAGKRVTGPRLAVYAAVAAHGHLDADGVGRAVRRELGSVSTQTVYDALGVCASWTCCAGSSRPAARRCTRRASRDNHHHLVCRALRRRRRRRLRRRRAPCLDPADAAASSSTRPKSPSGACAPPANPTRARRPPPHERATSSLTDRQGHPVYDNQNQRTVGARGPATLENYQFLEKISHFDRERIPERVVHARGATAFGYFEAYGTSATSRSPSTPAPSSSRRRASRPRSPSASPPWPAAATPPRRRATRAASR